MSKPGTRTITQNDAQDFFFHYSFDEYHVSTNLWGAKSMKEAVPAFTFNLDTLGGESGGLPAYDWSITDEFTKPIFPYVGIGARMWKKNRDTTTPRLPIRVSDIAACNLHYRLKIDEAAFRGAKGNLAVDVWFGDEASANDASM